MSRRERGYTLVALIIGIAILTILITAIAPSVGAIMKRDREQELIFRGRQYARAIALFQRRYGRYPNQFKELYENRPRTIRKLWNDPMCNCDFHPLIQGMPESIPGGAPGPTLTPTPSLFSSSPFGGTSGQNAPIGPIVGVRSTVHKEALQQWRGQRYYDQWSFIVGDADRDYLGPTQGLPPGMPQYAPTPAK